MSPGLRRFALTAHITASLGWLGAVVAFLALAIVGLASEDVLVVRAAYLAAEPITRYVIVPLALLSLLTGLVQALGSAWGLFRHYWVLFKLLITVLATGVLLGYTRTVSHVAEAAAQPGAGIAEVRNLSFVLHSAGGLLALLAATVLAVYRPRAMTRYGRRRSIVASELQQL